ncbi:MAG: PEP-CTERM system TPR-repeat protein PrsT [Burkholderiales bacterium]|nr:PEP-CTERM system TPR-repeat protein PrsT [Burkholderiales bacterium]
MRADDLLRAFLAPLLVCASLLVAGCGEKPEAMVASAKSYLAKGELNAATIQLKNALQKKPEDGEARYLLGTTLLAAGDPASAEKELRRALEYGYSPDAAYPELARALLAQGAANKVTSELADRRLTDAGAQAKLLALVGDAYLATRKPKEARAAFDAALRAKPDSQYALLGEVRMKAIDGDLETAGKLVDQVLAGAPEYVDALSLKGDLLAAKGDTAGAIQAYEKVIALRPSDASAHYNRVVLLARERQLDRAVAALADMKKAAPRDPRTFYAQALLAVAQGKPADAREPLSQILKGAPNHVPTLLLAGSVEYQLRSYPLAEDYFRRALSQAPQLAYARRMLTATYLRSGQPQRALETFEPLLKQVGDDPQLLGLAGEVYLANNQLDRASAYFQKSLAADPKGAAARTRLGQVRLATGDVDRAISDLEAASEEDKGQIQADLVLVMNYVRNREFDKALAAVATIEKKQPDNPLTYNLKAAIYLGKRDLPNARKNLEHALALKQDYAPALYNLVRLDLAEKRPDQARQRFDTILAKDPKNEVALLGLAELQAATRAPRTQIAATLEKAVAGNPTSARARIALINFHLQGADGKSALAAAMQARADFPDNARILELLGLSQLAAGDSNSAIATFGKLEAVAPNSPAPLLRLAGAQLAAKDVAGAIQSLRKALEINPDLVPVRQRLAALYLQQGKPDAALGEAKAVQKRHPDQPAGYVFEGDVHAAQKQWPAAERSYREALKHGKATVVAARLHSTLEVAGKRGEADAFAQKWLKENPKDAAFQLYLGDRSLATKDYAQAAKHYHAAVELQPESAVALNNLAWVSAQLKDPKAVEYAEKALALAPGSPAVQDTLGWMLAEKGELARGVDLLKQAAAGAPNAGEIRLHLAKALIKSGDKNGARQELEAVVKLEQQPAARAEAEKLLATL